MPQIRVFGALFRLAPIGCAELAKGSAEKDQHSAAEPQPKLQWLKPLPEDLVTAGLKSLCENSFLPPQIERGILLYTIYCGHNTQKVSHHPHSEAPTS